MTFDKALEMLYAPNVSGAWGRRDLYEDRIQKITQAIDLNEISFTYIKDPFGDTNNPSLILFTLNYLINVDFAEWKIRMSFHPIREVEQIIFEDDLKNNVILEIKFKNSNCVKFTSDDCNDHYKRIYSEEIYKVLKIVQGWHYGIDLKAENS